MTLSENRCPAPLESGTPKQHSQTPGNISVYRFEPNSDLYEGLRYLWINITMPSDNKQVDGTIGSGTGTGSDDGPAVGPWHITALRRVNQVMCFLIINTRLVGSRPMKYNLQLSNPKGGANELQRIVQLL